MRQRGGFSSQGKLRPPPGAGGWIRAREFGVAWIPRMLSTFFVVVQGFLEALVRKLSSPAAAHTQNAARCVIKPQPSRREKTLNKATVPRRGCLKPKTSAAEQRLAVFK